MVSVIYTLRGVVTEVYGDSFGARLCNDNSKSLDYQMVRIPLDRLNDIDRDLIHEECAIEYTIYAEGDPDIAIVPELSYTDMRIDADGMNKCMAWREMSNHAQKQADDFWDEINEQD